MINLNVKTSFIKLISISLIYFFIFFSCAANNQNNKILTLGLIQKNVQKGLTQTDILENIGSPNIITKNNKGNEVWTYDRISNEKRSNSLGLYLLNPFNWFFIGSSNSNRSTNSSKALTVIINYDENKRVIDYSYQSIKY